MRALNREILETAGRTAHGLAVMNEEAVLGVVGEHGALEGHVGRADRVELGAIHSVRDDAGGVDSQAEAAGNSVLRRERAVDDVKAVAVVAVEAAAHPVRVRTQGPTWDQ